LIPIPAPIQNLIDQFQFFLKLTPALAKMHYFIMHLFYKCGMVELLYQT